MSVERAILIVEPEENRRQVLVEALAGVGEVVEAAVYGREALESRCDRERLVVALPRSARRSAADRREVLRQRTLDLLARARELGVSERALDGRGCDIELYTAARSIGAEVWPESTAEEAALWYRNGLTLTVPIKDRIARDIARAHVYRDLELTRAELALLFQDLLDGGSYEKLGDDLGITAHTVKAHFRNMRQNTGLSRDELRSRALEALVFARGFVERE